MKSLPSFRNTCRFLLPITLVVLGSESSTGSVIWDNSAGTNAWSTPANWDTNIEPLSTDDVILPAGLAATLTLSNSEKAQTLQFADDYTLTGGGLALTSTSTIQVASGKTAIITTPLTVTGGTTKTGDGTLALNGSNTFSGGISLSAGTLRIGHANAIGTTTNSATIEAGTTLEIATGITFARNITLKQGGTIAGTGTATSTGIVTIDAGATAVTLATSSLTDVLSACDTANDLTGGSAATVVSLGGTGSVRLGNSSNFDGSWIIPTGRLDLAAAGALGDTTTSSVTLSGGSLAGRATSGLNFTASPANNLLVTADSSLLSDRTSASSGLTYTFGTLSIGTRVLTVAPGTNATSGTAGITTGNVTLSGNPTFAVNDNGATNGKLTTASLLGGGPARNITKSGAGDLAVTGGSTDLPAGSHFTATGGGTIEMVFPALGAATPVTITAAQNPFW